MFWGENIDEVLIVLDPLLWDSDRFRQRAAAEILAGILRGRLASFKKTFRILRFQTGAKHWPKPAWDKLWAWTTARLDRIFTQIKPDTLTFWELLFSVCNAILQDHFLLLTFRIGSIGKLGPSSQ